MAHNTTITATIFNVESEAFQAFYDLKLNCSSKNCHVSQAALVKKENDGIKLYESFGNASDRSQKEVKWTLIGAVVGLIMGPLGALLGGGIGALMAADDDDSDYVESASLLECVCQRILEGETVIVALFLDDDEVTFDELMNKYDAQILRWSAADIRNEVKEARELQNELARQARLEMRSKRSHVDTTVTSDGESD